MATGARWPLETAVLRLERQHGRPRAPVATDPFAMAVWEACAYLVPDERREMVYRSVEEATALDPLRIRELGTSSLAALIADGGMQPMERARKLEAAADIAIEHGARELRKLIRTDPARAKRVFRNFPGIGEPGADKMLLFNRGPGGLAPDSNALRVLLRLGFGRPGRGYAAEYRSVQHETAPELRNDPRWRIRAHQLLRRHGQEICKSGSPRCGECELAERCPARAD